MGLAILLIKVVAEWLNRFRLGRLITTGVATVVIAWAVVVACLTTTLLVMAVLGYYP